MKVTAVKTHKITGDDKDIFTVLDSYLTEFNDKSILVIASKILSITQGRILEGNLSGKDEIIKKEADYYLPPDENTFGLYITRKNNLLTYSSGMDVSNGNGTVVLWPENIQDTTNRIREYVSQRFGCSSAGVIITDMTAIPLQRGVIAGPIGFSGFIPFRDLSGTPDLFGRKFKHTVVGIVQGLAAAAGVVMGEGSDQTPLAVIEDIPFVTFQDRNPTEGELMRVTIPADEDLFGPLLTGSKWKKGGE